MTLDELHVGNSAKVLSINANEELRKRLYSFGIVKQSIVKMIEHTLAKNTIEIKINNTRIGMRNEEAKAIEVELYE